MSRFVFLNKANMETNAPLPPGQYFGIPSPGRQTNGCTFLESSYPAESSLPWHSHEAPFFCLLLSGTYCETYGSRNWVYEPGSVVFHPAGETHRTSMGRKGGNVFLIEIGGEWLHQMNQLPSSWITRCEAPGTPVSWLARQIQSESQSALTLEGLVMELLDRTNQIEKIRYAPQWLDQVMEFIRDNWQTSFTIKDLAGKVGVHPFHLARVFRFFNGTSIGEYVQRLRIDAAIRRVRENRPFKMCDLALDLGFADQSHFTRTFKKLTGLSPVSFVNRFSPK